MSTHTATFTENWFDQVSQDRLAELGRLVDNVPGVIVEIGSWEGRSTCVLANAIRPREVIAIDTWQGSPGEISHDLAAERDVHATFATNVAALTGGNVREWRSGWRDAIPQIDDPIALCFIDAEHTYREVYDNIQAVLPKLASGGVLCGDDAGHPPVRRAVLDLLPEQDVFVKGNVWSWRKPALADMYRTVASTPSDIYLHLPRFVELVTRSKATKVLELGTRTGVSTIAWLHALEQTGGHLWSVDIDSQPPIGQFPHWTFIQGDDMDGTVQAQLPAPFDIVFLDTSHHYQHTKAELDRYQHMVRPGGLIVCHDTELPIPEGAPAGDPTYPVKRAIEEFVAATGRRWLNIPDCWGLGIIEVNA